MRIIAGEKGGMRLLSPPGSETRPTLERVRESLFMVLQPHLEGAVVLDLFAGAGTLGLEALSRGAARATFVERARGALEVLKKNIRHLGYKDRATVVEADAARWLSRIDLAEDRFDLLFIDPPYARDLIPPTMERLAKGAETWLLPKALIIAQAGKRDEVAEVYGPLHAVWEKTYGDTKIVIYRYDPPGSDASGGKFSPDAVDEAGEAE